MSDNTTESERLPIKPKEFVKARSAMESYCYIGLGEGDGQIVFEIMEAYGKEIQKLMGVPANVSGEDSASEVRVNALVSTARMHDIEKKPPEVKYERRDVLCYCLVTPSPAHRDEGKYNAWRLGWIDPGDNEIFLKESETEKERFYDLEILRWIPLGREC